MKDKIIVKLEIIVIIQGNKDRGAAHRICNLKYSRPKNIPIAFHYWSNYQYHFIMKMLAKEFKKQFIFLGNIDKYLIFTVPMEKKQEYRNGDELPKIYPTDHNLLIAQDLWKTHEQMLSIIFLKEFIKLNVNMDTMIKNVKLEEVNISIVTTFLNTKTLKMI